MNGYKKFIEKKSSTGTSFTSNHEVDVSAEFKGINAETTVPPIVGLSFGSSEEFRSNKEFFVDEKGSF